MIRKNDFINGVATRVHRRWLGSITEDNLSIFLISAFTGFAALIVHLIIRQIENPVIWVNIVFFGGMLVALVLIQFNNHSIKNAAKLMEDNLTKRHGWGFLEEGAWRLYERGRGIHEETLFILFAFVDADHLKAINDTLGHAVGDLTIIEIHEFLCDVIQEGDYALRKSGDEFIILALTRDPVLLTEKFTNIFNKGFHCNAAQRQITMSTGTTWLKVDEHNPPESKDFFSSVEIADMHMYLEKMKKKGIR